MATIGPSCESVETLVEMIKSGMSIARLNFSHGTHETHKQAWENARLAEKKTGVHLTIVQDLQGPKIRLGNLPEGGIEIKDGEKIVLNTALVDYKKDEIPFVFPGLQKYLNIGERLLIDDGKIEIKITAIKGSKVYCTVVEGGIVKSKKGVNFPESDLGISAISEKDKEDLKFGLKLGFHTVAISFVNSADDIKNFRALIKKYEKELRLNPEYPVKVIVKIERREAIHNIKTILEECDGVMIARGDLGLEMPAAELPLMQKKIIALCKSMAKPVIVATQMLDSMQDNRRPTRAEVSDVANAVFEHADVLMLSNETATGKYPVKTVKVMSQIIHTTERAAYTTPQTVYEIGEKQSVDISVAQSACVLAEDIGARIILAASLTGETGRLVSSLRPYLPIVVATSSDRVYEQLNLSWGVNPMMLLPCKTIEELVGRAVKYIVNNEIAQKGDKMVIVAGEPVGQAGNLNLIEVKEMK